MTTTQTFLPGRNCKSSRAAKVKWTSNSAWPQSTNAETMTSLCSTRRMVPGRMLRALRPRGFSVASRRSPARIPTRKCEPTSARTRGVSNSTVVLARRQVMVPRASCRAWTVASKVFSSPERLATVSDRGARMTSCGRPCATILPASSTTTSSPKANTSSPLWVTKRIGTR